MANTPPPMHPGARANPAPLDEDVANLIRLLPRMIEVSERHLVDARTETPTARHAAEVWALANDAVHALVRLFEPEAGGTGFRVPRLVMQLVARWVAEAEIRLRWLEANPLDGIDRTRKSTLLEGARTLALLGVHERAAEVNAAAAAMQVRGAPNLRMMAESIGLKDAYACYSALCKVTHHDVVISERAVADVDGAFWALGFRAFVARYADTVEAAARLTGVPFRFGFDDAEVPK